MEDIFLASGSSPTLALLPVAARACTLRRPPRTSLDRPQRAQGSGYGLGLGEIVVDCGRMHAPDFGRAYMGRLETAQHLLNATK